MCMIAATRGNGPARPTGNAEPVANAPKGGQPCRR